MHRVAGLFLLTNSVRVKGEAVAVEKRIRITAAAAAE